MRGTLTVILAGGKGTRLEPLTRDRAKPAVPFGGQYRIIDFTLSNCLNSGLRRILLLTQYKAQSLDRHIRRGWNFLSAELGESIEVLPPQQRIDENWYQGTADAIYQNIYSIEKEDKDLVLILGGDHIYKMDYADMVESHRERRADLTIGCIPIPLSESRHFGILKMDSDNRIVGFEEKPKETASMPGDPGRCLGSMGIYIFSTRLLLELLCEDANQPGSSHDFGKDIIPRMIPTHGVFAFPFRDRNLKSEAYWRDVGTLDAYYQSNMDLVEVDPVLNLYDASWPIRTFNPQYPPPKFVFSEEGASGQVRRGEAHDSMICSGCILSGGHVRRSILSPNVRVNSYSLVENSILFEGVEVGRHCRVRNAIIDKGVRLPTGTVLGYDLELEQRRGLTISEGGIVIVAKGTSPERFQLG
ncbi:glucose-1-phosphate adenylyltransferase [Telmatocola sphagniphila]|jgi:glucose-1-phosphate adenylyltransferase|uniref:Glucose-1-phosphate adenylyltransferase n=1 Tax=Telmatocola sphagniphila TaxID=1123043 RepID=A0A8E6B5S2_9BACT|nr:glucose-1-phosphate adenylyltransferase [Telmatocola sphagniphila]QVL31979.1 glucose-1-phosphate adenylyltransferase [Telmatocola sphagniphila]